METENEITITRFLCKGMGMHYPAHYAFAYIESVTADNIKIGRRFKRKDENVIYTRIKFEDKLTVLYKDVENVAANIGWDNVWFIPCNELVNEVVG